MNVRLNGITISNMIWLERLRESPTGDGIVPLPILWKVTGYWMLCYESMTLENTNGLNLLNGH